MINNYLNLYTDDIEITNIIKKSIKKCENYKSIEEFKDSIITLDNIRNDDLCEDDDDLIADFYDNLNKTHRNEISKFLKDKTTLNSGQTLGELMYFLHTINY